MKVKKFFANFIVLLIFSAVVFFIGWIQFYVRPGTCAIMKSKTGGLYHSAVVPGVFTWRWERLLPTNVSLEIFDLSVYKATQSVSGEEIDIFDVGGNVRKMAYKEYRCLYLSIDTPSKEMVKGYFIRSPYAAFFLFLVFPR